MNTFATLTPRQQEHFRAYLTETQHHAKCVQEFIMGDSEPLKDRLARMEKRAARAFTLAITSSGVIQISL